MALAVSWLHMLKAKNCFETSHGLYRGAPELRYELIEKTALISDIPLVIHGGTGLTKEMFLQLLTASRIT